MIEVTALRLNKYMVVKILHSEEVSTTLFISKKQELYSIWLNDNYSSIFYE